MKNFCDIEIGDSVYFIAIDESKIDSNNSIEELTVVDINDVANATHLRVKLSDNTVITPSGLFPFHSIDISGCSSKDIDVLSSVTTEIYATSREECLRIASNTIKIKMRQIHKVMEACKNSLDELGKCAIDLLELKDNLPTEVMAESVIV